MAITMLLPEDGADTPVAFDLPKKIAPYARELFDDLKQEGETFNEFVCRIICEQGVTHVRKTAITVRDTTRRTEQLTDDSELGAEASNLLNP